MRRIAAPDFLLLAAIPAVCGREAYCKEIAAPSLTIFQNDKKPPDTSCPLGIVVTHPH
jgi:hypothetical protein